MPPRRLVSAVLPVLTLLLPATSGAVELELELGLFNRFSLTRNRVEQLLRYDEAQNAFDTASYLNPVLDRTDFSFLATAGIYLGLTRWFGVGFSVDSGLVTPTGKEPKLAPLPVTTHAISRLTENELVCGAGNARCPVPWTTDLHRVTSNGQPFKDEAGETYLIRQAFLRFAAPETEWFSAELGRRGMRVGDGLIYDDFGLGATIMADLERLRDTPLRFTSQVILPARGYDEGLRSPLVELRGEYLFSMLESLALHLAYFHDGDNNFGRLFSPLISESLVRAYGRNAFDPDLLTNLYGLSLSLEPDSSANLAWFGASGNKIFGDSFMVQGAFFFQLGRLRLDPGLDLSAARTLVQNVPLSDAQKTLVSLFLDQGRELSVRSVALDLGARYLLSDTMVIGSWFLYLSGATNPFFEQQAARDGTYGGFLSVVPYLTRTNLFFSGGMNETFTGRQATTAGINGRGVIAGALTWEWEPWDLKLSSTAAALSAAEPSHQGGRFYGVEVDLDARWDIASWLGLSLEYDVLVPGSFFSRRSVIHQLMAGLDLKVEYAN